MALTTKTIEEFATNAVQKSILFCELLDPYISVNDKEPSWDGFVYIYSNARKTKEDFRGRVPVQVKGHEHEDLSGDTIKEPIQTVDLRSYLRDGGVLYFSTYLAQKGRENRIYYIALTPELLRDLLAECKEKQQSKTVTMYAFPEDEEARTEIFREFERKYRPHSENVARSLDQRAAEEIRKSGMDFLKGIVCQRLTADPDNRVLLNDFQCRANEGLAYYLKYNGWEEDLKGDTTYYLVKNPENQILMFFSLKCGNLFEKLNFDMDELRQQMKHLKNQLEHGNDLTSKERFRLYSQRWAIQEHIESLEMDLATDPNRNNIQVDVNHSAVELMHLCVNDLGKEYWHNQLRKHAYEHRNMGEMLYWLYVVPAICDVQDSAGCQYVYTFVPDASTDGRLIRYYENQLHFQQSEHLGVTKPRYDLMCPFMCQEINSLREDRVAYFDMHSHDE